MTFNKKAGLNLSIQAIVIIVLAMTLLGLGLTFIRGLIGNIEDLSESTFQRISEQLSTDLATSDSTLIFSSSRLTLERGDSKLEGFGVRNDGSSEINFGLKIEAIDCPDSMKDVDGNCPEDEIGEWFNYIKGDKKYKVGAANKEVYRLLIQDIPRDTARGLYLMRLSVYLGKLESDSACNDDYTVNPNTGAENGCEIFGQTELFLTIA